MTMLFNPMITTGIPGATTTTTTTVRSYGYGATPYMPHTGSIFGGYPMMGSYPVIGGYGVPMMGGYYGGGYNSGLDTMLQVGAGIALGSAVAKTGIVETLFSGIGKAASWTWNKAIKPGATWLWNNAIQPAADWTWNKALKPAGQWIGKTATNIYNGAKEKIAEAREAAAAKKAAKAAEAEA